MDCILSGCKPKVKSLFLRWFLVRYSVTVRRTITNRCPSSRAKDSHSLEGPRVAEVWFSGGAGTLVCPLPRTQLAKAGKRLSIRTGDAAAGKECGCRCSTQRHGPQGVSWLKPSDFTCVRECPACGHLSRLLLGSEYGQGVCRRWQAMPRPE